MPDNTISQFMWGYQPHFRISAEGVFERIAKGIGAAVTPHLFLVGVTTNEDAQHAICVEPESGIQYTQETFADMWSRYEQAREADPRAGMLQSHPVAQQNEKRRLHFRSLNRAIVACIEAQDDVKNVTFCSNPVTIGSYYVCVVLQIPAQEVSAYAILATSQWAMTPYHVYPLMQSLLHAAAQVFLEECWRALWVPDAHELDCNVEDVAREAGRRMMSAPASLGQAQTVVSLDSGSLFEACNMISASRYEGAPSIGEMLVSRRDNPSVAATIALASPVALRDYRGIRKLLELAAEGHHLLCDGSSVYGIGRLDPSYDPSTEGVFRIRFTKHHRWELVHDNNPLMIVEYGNARLPGPPFDLMKFRQDLSRFFPDILEEQAARLCALVLQACEQRHGTTVVISAAVAQEAKRLQGQATLIQPTPLNKETVPMVTSIDGGILIDPSGICHAIGVILDGPASPKGNPSRGGRYNSAVRYTEANPGALCVVVSVDGTVDIVPNLRRQISRGAIEDLLVRLSDLAKQERVEAGDYNRTISILRSISFYLKPDDCVRANQLIEETYQKINWEDGAIVISKTVFAPHPDMNDSYYLPREV